MAGGELDRRAGGERPRLTLRQRLSIKHLQLIWEAVLDRIGRGYRRKKKKRKRRKKQEAARQMQKEMAPELKTLALVRSARSARDPHEDGGCLAMMCGCLDDQSRRSRLTVTGTEGPPLYSNDTIISGIVPPLRLQGPPRHR